ncbi:mannitol-1-phosphate 5-dehydrogenase [Salicibibacter halophilus]|uniref:Mannitol-1-phosphate 5-dehydrogenase n=1 Tax=Salicibibacter halophilus TaxID=2502791 RepID=A0A514LHU1_9BACI|nr:mannitol-1-phosphate 5-dehydrogenase [Salicibibacter halophilus]QDI91416.1 mannitol-1-phosphate 5-dehydrogenase [Salicibibacter halophilus]
MEAVHFGAGNIGRGFIGALLHEAGYSVTFVDVNDELIQALKKREKYTVHIASDKQTSFEVTGVDGLNSQTEETEVLEALQKADAITTAVGTATLPMIAPIIAKGLTSRVDNNHVNVIACENAIRATSMLREEIFTHLTEGEKRIITHNVGFADAAVDRIVPSVASDDVLEVTVEPFFEWIVEKPSLAGDIQLGEATLVDDLAPYLERKLFTVNSGHAAAAYRGYRAGKERILDAMADTEIETHVRKILEETSIFLIENYGFNVEAHEAYVEKIMERFKNPYLQDTVVRVGRGPIRKLGEKDRIVRPAKAFAEKGKEAKYLIMTIIDALHFYADGDAESEKLKKMVQTEGELSAFLHFSGLSAEHPLAQQVKAKL